MSNSSSIAGKQSGMVENAAAVGDLPLQALPAETRAAVQLREAPEKYIPVRRAELVDLLLQTSGAAPDEQTGFRELCRMLAARLHHDFHAKLEELKELYAEFDPDTDTRNVLPRKQEDSSDRANRLIDKVIDLLKHANFEPLSQADIIAAMDTMSEWGQRLHIDFDVFERLEVYARGDSIERRLRRLWRKLYREHEIDVVQYRRLVLIFRLRPHRRLGRHTDTRVVYLKLFKNIPKKDLEMLLPGSQVRMSLLDRGKIVFPTVSGLTITGVKIFQGAIAVATFSTASIVALLGLVGGTMGYSARSFFGYMQTKQKYQLNLTQSLYFQNLDNNEGVLCRLVDAAEEQEGREACLAYYFLWREPREEGWTQADLDRRIEQFLHEKLGFKVDFEAPDAFGKLVRFGLVTEQSGRYHAVPLRSALQVMDHSWDGIFQHHKTTSSPQHEADN